MDNLRGLLGIMRMDRMPNTWIEELGRVIKGVGKRMKLLTDVLAILKEWIMIGLLKGYMWEDVWVVT